MHQQNLTTVTFYIIITANVYQLNLTTACSYSIITTDVNKSLPLYISTSQTQSSAMFLSVMMTQLRYHHNSHSLLSAAHH